ncbi:hypothetical protein Tco_0448963 [Tanacetum coccineum]
MHNNIMAAGSRDRPPMLATERYDQWQSRFIRYVDTKPNVDALRKCILQGPYKLCNVTVPAQPATNDSPAAPEHTDVETLTNISAVKKTAHDMWIAIEKLQQGESLNKQDVKTSLYGSLADLLHKDGESIE